MARPGQGFGFWLRGIEPVGDLAWSLAGSVGRRRFWTAAADFARVRYNLERRLGVGIDGFGLAPLSPVTIANRRSAGTRHPDPNAPPFIPGYDLSRTITLLRANVTESGVWFTWARDNETGLPWGQILHWHATGQVAGAPARNVIGISPAGIAAIQSQAARWWKFSRNRIAGRALSRTVTAEAPTVLRLPEPVPVRPRDPGINLDLATWHSGSRESFERRFAAGTATAFSRDAGQSRGPFGSGPTRPPRTPRPPQGPAPRPGPAVLPLRRRGVTVRPPKLAESLQALLKAVEDRRRSEDAG
jgi:hypothetical protein